MPPLLFADTLHPIYNPGVLNAYSYPSKGNHQFVEGINKCETRLNARKKM